MDVTKLFSECRSGVAQIVLERDRERLTNGSAFLVHGGLVTNSHVLDVAHDTVVIRFEDMEDGQPIRLSSEAIRNAIRFESPPNESDVVFVELRESEFDGRHIFSFSDYSSLRVGQAVAFLGYPFGMNHLTCHLGHVSSLHENSGVPVAQIDGSVNGGNSGGPMLELDRGCVAAVVTRAHSGFVAEQFDKLLEALGKNVELLNQPRSGRASFMGFDPLDGLLASQAAMHQIAINLRRSANVGIGYAFSADLIARQIRNVGDAENTDA